MKKFNKILFGSLSRRFLSNKALSKTQLDAVKIEAESRIEKQLFGVISDLWASNKIPKIQKAASRLFLSILFGGGLAANYFDEFDKELSRDIITAEIHLLSSYLAFTSGIRSGLLHFLGCGIVPRRFNWMPHYMQIASLSQVLAAAFASGSSDASARTVLYFLSICFAFAAGNDYIASRWSISPKWIQQISIKQTASIFLGIVLLLLCESQTLPGRAPQLWDT